MDKRMFIRRIDDFTGEIQDNYGNWHDSYEDFYDVMLNNLNERGEK